MNNEKQLVLSIPGMKKEAGWDCGTLVNNGWQGSVLGAKFADIANNALTAYLDEEKMPIGTRVSVMLVVETP